jgi:hypothetical protein
MRDMPDLNIRNIDKSLLIAVNVAAAKADMTQRDWVIGVLTEASVKRGGLGNARTEALGVEVSSAGESYATFHEAEPSVVGDQRRPSPGSSEKTVEGVKCFCGSPVVTAKGSDAGPMRYKCIARGHFSTIPVKGKAETDG